MGQQKYIESFGRKSEEEISTPHPPPPTAQQSVVDQALIITQVSQSHSFRHITLDRSLWTSDQPDADTSTRQSKTLKRQTSMPPVGFEPAIPGKERPQTHALDRAATGIGMKKVKHSEHLGVDRRVILKWT